jgi:arginine/ornithine N-succinyltransferase beta subunit
MTEPNNQQTSISAEEVLRTEIIVSQALIDILIAKQIISEEELVNSIRKIRYELVEIIDDQRNTLSMKRQM